MKNPLLTLAAETPELAQNFEDAMNNIENSGPNYIFSQAKAILQDFWPRVLVVLFILLFSHVFIETFIKIVKKLLARSKVDATLHSFILSVLKNAIRVVVIITCLLILKMPASPLVTLIGSVGLALSLALKDSLANVAGGISILFSHPFAKGDLVGITLGGNTIIGTVSAIDLVYTQIMTDDDKIVYLTNGDVTRAIVTNYSSEPLKRLDLVFFIPVESSFEKAKEIISSMLGSSAYTLKQPVPVININGRNEDSYIVSCKIWTKAGHYDAISASLSESIDLKLKQSGM